MPTKLQIKNSLRGYSMKRTKPEIIDMIQTISRDYDKEDPEGQLLCWNQVIILYWCAGMEPHMAKEATKDLIELEG